MADKNEFNQAGLLGAIAASTLFVVTVLALLLYFDLDDPFLRWLDTLGWWAPPLFILAMALVVVLLLPGFPFTTSAGFMFGVSMGTLCVVLGITLGAALAFLIARKLFGERTARYVLQHPKLRMLSNELVPHGWKIVMLSRMVPFFPFKLSNYFFGLTAVSLRDFVSGTLLGIIPFSLHNVYLGAIAAEVVRHGAQAKIPGSDTWLLLGAGFLLVLAGVVHFSHMAWRALAQYADPVEE